MVADDPQQDKLRRTRSFVNLLFSTSLFAKTSQKAAVREESIMHGALLATNGHKAVGTGGSHRSTRFSH